MQIFFYFFCSCDPGGTLTLDPQNRNLMLYTTELRGLVETTTSQRLMASEETSLKEFAWQIKALSSSSFSKNL